MCRVFCIYFSVFIVFGAAFACVPDVPLATSQSDQRFIQKAYLDFFGRQASERELRDRVTQVETEGRLALVDTLIGEREYSENFILGWTVRLYPNIFDLESFYDDLLAANQEPAAQMQIEAEADAVLNVVDDLHAGTIRAIDAIEILVSTWVFEEENMGAINYTRALFEQVMGRTPDPVEEGQAAGMMDNFLRQRCDEPDAPTFVLFVQEGVCRDDLMSILFDNYLFYQYHTQQEFIRLLGREADAFEEASFAEDFMIHQDLAELQRSLVSLDEYSL